MFSIDVNKAKTIFEAASITDDVVMNMNKDGLLINISDQPRIMIAHITVDSEVLEEYMIEEEKVVIFNVDDFLVFCKSSSIGEKITINFTEEELNLRSNGGNVDVQLIDKIPNPVPEIDLSRFPGVANISGKQFLNSVRDIPANLRGDCSFICLEIDDNVIKFTSFDEVKKVSFECDNVNTDDSFKVKSCFPLYTLQHIAKTFAKMESIGIYTMEENNSPFHFKGETEGIEIGFTIAPRVIESE